MSLCQVGVGDGNGGFILSIGSKKRGFQSLRVLEGVREVGIKLGMKEVEGEGR